MEKLSGILAPSSRRVLDSGDIPKPRRLAEPQFETVSMKVPKPTTEAIAMPQNTSPEWQDPTKGSRLDTRA